METSCLEKGGGGGQLPTMQAPSFTSVIYMYGPALLGQVATLLSNS